MSLWLRIDAVEATDGGVAVTGDLRRGVVRPGDEVEVVGSHRAVPAQVTAVLQDGRPVQMPRGQATLVLENVQPQDAAPGWVVASPGQVRPVTRLLLDAHLLSEEALALHQLVARYNLARPDLARRIEAWQAGAEALRQPNPYAFLKELLGAVPQLPFEPPPRENLEIQLWQGGSVLRGTLSEPLALGRGKSGQVVVSLSSPGHAEPGEIFFLVSGWGLGAVVVGQVTVRSILRQSGLVETTLPERPPPLHELIGAAASEGPGSEPAPSDLSAWLVWADHLMDQGDPHGELMVAHATGQDPSPLLEAHAEALMGRFAGELAPYLSVDWQLGFWRSAVVHWVTTRARSPIELADLVEEVLSHPSARFLHGLAIESSQRGAEATATWRQALIGLTRKQRSLRELTLGELSEAHTVREPHGRCQLGPLWKALPELESLRVRCREVDLGLARGGAPSLRRLAVWSLSVVGVIERLRPGELSGLEALELCSFPEPCTEALDPLLDGQRLPALVRLSLVSCVSFDQALNALIGSALLPRLRSLSMAIRSTSWSDSIGALLTQSQYLEHLTELRLNRARASDTELRELRERLPNCRLSVRPP